MANSGKALLVNPWITDFAAHDLWARPLGLLVLGSMLRRAGWKTEYIDCLQRDPTDEGENAVPPTFGRFGTGKYRKEPMPAPEAVAGLERRYWRYGIPEELLEKKLARHRDASLVLVTCTMTYWYPGLRETIRTIRKVLPGSKVWLGGNYARLCREHAERHGGADRVFSGSMKEALEALGIELPDPFEDTRILDVAEAMEVVDEPRHAPLLLGIGCPQRCSYCASSVLWPGFRRVAPERAFRQLRVMNEKRGIRDFAFYDDALLFDANERIVPFLELVIRQGLDVRFHTPNGLFIRQLDGRLCSLMKEAGFETIRLGLETTGPSPVGVGGGKARMEDFDKACRNLFSAGFTRKQVGAYLLYGLPGQSPEQVAGAISTVAGFGVRPYLAEYSPIPGTVLFSRLPEKLQEALQREPLLQNNSCVPLWNESFDQQTMRQLKELARRHRALLDG